MAKGMELVIFLTKLLVSTTDDFLDYSLLEFLERDSFVLFWFFINNIDVLTDVITNQRSSYLPIN